MKIKKSVLVQVIREELAKHAKSLLESQLKLEADGDEEKKDKEPEKKDAKDAKAPPEKKPAPKGPPKPPGKTDAAQDKPAEELPAEDEPADAGLEKDVNDNEEDADEVTGGKIADEIAGKTVQSITMDPKSKLLPGAQEIVVTFDQIPDPLRILVNKTGQVKFYFRGLHNEL